MTCPDCNPDNPKPCATCPTDDLSVCRCGAAARNRSGLCDQCADDVFEELLRDRPSHDTKAPEPMDESGPGSRST